VSDLPEAYVKGVWPFMGYEFLTEKGTIYPREESGIVVKHIIELVRSGKIKPAPGEPLRIVDQCGGSGNLGCVIALSLPEAKVWTTDLLECASALAKRNIAKHKLEGRLESRNGDLFKPFADLAGQIDAISCSPPFISTGRLTKDRAYLLEHEPREAFDAGPYGISLHMRIVKECVPVLRPGGYLVCEFGEGQTKQVETLVTRAKVFDDIEVLSDEAGVQRAIRARKAIAAPSAV
jgi:release factor glutamine methyltransferase